MEAASQSFELTSADKCLHKYAFIMAWSFYVGNVNRQSAISMLLKPPPVFARHLDDY